MTETAARTKGNPFSGAALRRLRVAAGLNQGQLARRVHVTREHICAIEQGVKGPGSAVWHSLARALDVPMDALADDARDVA